MQMTSTFYSRFLERDLHSMHWKRLSGPAAPWPVLFRLLPALGAQARVLGTITGTIRVINQGTIEEWPLDMNAAALRERLESFGALSDLVHLSLACEPLLWLSDDHVEVIDYHSDDRRVLGRPTLSPVIGDPVGVPGLQPWCLREGPVTLLSLEVTNGNSAGVVALRVRSGCDFWLTEHLDGEPNLPHGEANARMLARAMEEIAAATGAWIS